MIRYTPKPLNESENINVARDSLLGELAKLLAGTVALIAGCYLLLGLLVDMAVPWLPVELEKPLGDAYLHQFPGLNGNLEENRRLQAILDRLQSGEFAAKASQIKVNYKVYFSPSNTMNAITLPGGHIIVFKGLRDKLTSDEEMAFVLGHELGHIRHRDHLRGLGRSLLSSLALIVCFGSDNALSKLSMASGNILNTQFSQQQEFAADDYALTLLNRHYHHTQPALGFFNKLAQEEKGQSNSGFLSTHPATEARIERMKRQIRTRGYQL